MRKLASIRKVKDIRVHTNADNLELIDVDGWQVVSQKGLYKPDDLVVYFEIDSFLPVRGEFEFLRKCCFRSTQNLGDGFRIKTVKLRGEISQGLLVPIWQFFEKSSHDQNWYFEDEVDYIQVGEDVTDRLGVKKWELPGTNFGADAKGGFPSYIPKTDQERIQNICIESIPEGNYEITEKLEGSSMTVFLNNGEFGVCSRNVELKEGDNVFWNTAKKYNLENVLHTFNGNYAIQGELVGPGIQGNIYKLTEHKFYVFDIYDIKKGRYLYFDERIALLNNHLFHAPILGFMNKKEMVNHERNGLLRIAEDVSLVNTNVEREGIVFKSTSSQFSFKAISNKYLLKEKE